MSKMYVANCLNEYYAPFSYTMLKSLFETNRAHEITVFLLHDGLSEKSKKSFFDLAKEYGQSVDLIFVHNFAMDEKVYTYGGWNELTMYRLLLWDILPKDVDRVLHLDGDMIVNGDLGSLYDMDFDGSDLIACRDVLAATYRKDYCIKTHGKDFAHLFEEGKYFNAGMMVMNVAKNRGKELLKTYEELAKKQDYVLPYPDQDLLNLYHEDKVLYVDTLSYNFPGYDGCDLDGGFDEARLRKEVKILHYLDKKPWSQGDHKFYDGEKLWWDVFETTPYRDVLKKDIVIAVMVLDENADVKTTLKSGSENLKDYFRDFRFVIADAVGKRNNFVKGSDPFKGTFYMDCSKRDFPTVAALKNYVARSLPFDQILFLTAGETVGEPEFFDETRPEVINEVLIKEGTPVFDRAMFGKEVFDELGGFTEELLSDEDYELALRAFFYSKAKNDLFWIDKKMEKGIYESTYDAYAFVIAMCQNELRENGIFDEVISRRLEEAKAYGVDSLFAIQMESYLKTNKFKKPILILNGVSECQGALDSFAAEFGEALRKEGAGVIFAKGDGATEDLNDLLLKPLSAVVGFQSMLFGKELSDGSFFGNAIRAPKFQFLFDHPIYMTTELSKDVKNVYVLSQDETYAEYVNEKLKTVACAYHFPPAGIELVYDAPKNKTMDVSFIGTYYDYRNQLDQMDTLPRNYHEISNRFYERQKAHPNERAEEALTNVLNDMGYETTDEEFVECLFAMGHAVRALMYYFREKVVETLLNGGVKVDVYSDSWKKAPFANHENLRIHPEVSFEESLSVMAESKMSLNIMSWHKGGMTERLNNAMLNKSLCVTDETTYIKREFPEEMLQFNLEDFSDLPDRVKELLDDDAAREAMIRRAYEKAVATQTWECRAKEFLQLLEDI